MKCAYHSEAEATETCTSCAMPICQNCSVKVDNKVCCRTCIDEAFMAKKTRLSSLKLTISGILGMIAGFISLLGGIGLISRGLDKGLYQSTNWTEVGFGITIIATGIVAIVGSYFALTRKSFGLSLAGATCAIVPFWFLGIPALLLVAFSKDRFDLEETLPQKKTESKLTDFYQPIDPFNRGGGNDKLF